MKIKSKVILLAVISSLLLFIVSPFHPMQYRVFADGEYSTIGGIAVSDLKDNELRAALENGIANWKTNTIVIEGAGTSIEIDPSLVQFDLDATIAQYKAQTDKAWFAFWKKRPTVQLPFTVLPNEEIRQSIASQPLWDTDATYGQFMAQASFLRTQPIEATVSVNSNIDNERLLAAIREVPADISGTQEIADILTDRIIGTEEEYSFLKEVDPLIGSASQMSLNFVASLLYETALKMNAQIVERHQHQVLPAYLTAGLDATVQLSQEKDLRFINMLEQPVKLKVTREGLTLKAEIFAAVEESVATVRVSRDQDVMPRTIIRYTKELPIGQRQVLQEGSQGLRVSVYRTNNTTGEEKLISRDYYAPVNNIVLASSRQPAVSDGIGGSTGDGTGADNGDGTGTGSGNVIIDENGNIVEGPTTGGENVPGADNESGGTGTGSNNGSGSSNGEPTYDKGGNIINSGS